MLQRFLFSTSLLLITSPAVAQVSSVECAWQLSQSIDNELAVATACQGTNSRDAASVIRCLRSFQDATEVQYAANACQGVNSRSSPTVRRCFSAVRSRIGDEPASYLCQGVQAQNLNSRLRCYQTARQHFEPLAAAIMCGGRQSD